MVRKLGNSLEVRLNTGGDEALIRIESPDGTDRLTPCDPAFEEKMAKADDIISRYRNTLHVLAK